ncbi:MAG: hypothetical protein QF845_06370 [Candidatus Marinimicrobia bacterium]|nr:hypothetical protein [Candidatus Neomarinimicrobiota bacterium]MDP7072929.1 hypothetical protein [Candidatus Neomarinimicrobiota bacterium]
MNPVKFRLFMMNQTSIKFMRAGPLFAIALFLTADGLMANYAFYKKVGATCKYYRIESDTKNMNLTTNDKGSRNFSLILDSNRNNFEMVMIVGFISAGQAMLHQKSIAQKKEGYNPVVPEKVFITVNVPMGKQPMIVSAAATEKQILSMVEGKIDSAEFMRQIKDSIQTL